MIRNFLLVALRNVKRQLSYAVINVLGLSIGIACSLVIFLFVYGEWVHDKHYANGDRIYRIGISFFNMGNFAMGPEKLGDYLPQEFEGIEEFTRVSKFSNQLVNVKGETFKELVYYIDPAFFKVFSYEFVSGDPVNSMKNINSVILTESEAERLFHEKDVIGKIIELGKSKTPYTVTGIVKDNDHPSHLKASIWAYDKWETKPETYWTSAAVFNYVLLRKGVTPQDLEAALDRIIEKQVYPSSGAPTANISLEAYKKDPNSVKFFVHNLRDIYLGSKLSLEMSPGGNESNLYIFSIIAAFILVLAAINFINLTTARATRRAKEVGIRKSLGTSRRKLIFQFLTESVMTSVIAMLLALAWAELFVIAFFWITGQTLSISLWDQWWNLVVALMFAVVVGLFAGLYPAFYLTSFVPAKVLKGFIHAPKQRSFRGVLVTFQFVVSTSLMICTGIVISQLHYIQEKDLGFSTENVVTFDNLFDLKENALLWRSEVMQNSKVVNASLHTGEPGNGSIMSFTKFQTPQMEEALTMNTYFADANFLEVMGIKLIEGRNFDPKLVSDTANVIINESAVRALGLKNAIGAEINKGMKVIGVVSDFHWESLRKEIGPVAILPFNEKKSDTKYFQLSVRFTGTGQSIIQEGKQMWSKWIKDEPLSYHYLDDNFGDLLNKEMVFGRAIGFFTALAILISCLGVFGLAAYTTEQRKKEIGIRKVFGASMTRIYVLVNSYYMKVIIIAFVIAVPVATWCMQKWLDGFSYHTPIQPLIFAEAGVLTIFITLGCVGSLAWRAATLNPAEVLKDE
jgi:putative ABC transport system permease protein